MDHYHSYEQAIRFIRTDEECIKCVSVAYSVALNHQGRIDDKKALDFCHKVAIKLVRIYNKKITKESSWSKVFTPSVVDRLKYFVFDNSVKLVKENDNNNKKGSHDKNII